jgi:hypothetical protein
MAKRHDHLFDGIAEFGALHAAAKRAILGKRRKPSASAFYANLEGELLRLEPSSATAAIVPAAM